MDSEKIERIKLNYEKIAELIRQRNETMNQIMELYKKSKAESKWITLEDATSHSKSFKS